MDMHLIREIRRKVEAGERLTPKELLALRDAAEREEGSSLKLALAHALSNADEDAAALALFLALREAHPGDVPIQLGYARALAGLERFEEANAVLEAAVAARPEDP
jgi:hypothetical protein